MKSLYAGEGPDKGLLDQEQEEYQADYSDARVYPLFSV